MQSMLLSKTQKAKKDADAAAEEERKASAIIIQCMIRCFLARVLMKSRARRIWQRVFDPKFKIYFWFNRLNGSSQWNLPKYMHLYTDVDHQATTKIQKICRGFVGRMKARRLVHEKYTRFYDANLNRFYWMENATQKTTWKVSTWLNKQNVPMPPEDEMIYKSTQKIRELEEKLQQKEEEIRQVRRKRYEELEPEVLKDRVASAKALKRSKHMDEWTIDELAAWFTELKMAEHIHFLYSNRVDGNLFINLTEDDWGDMGITNKFQKRKLNLILKAYRTRYRMKKQKLEDDDDLSEYAPSELSDILNAEDETQEDDSEEEEEDEFTSDEEEEDEADVELTDEQKAEKILDDENIYMQMLVPGDGLTYPMIGDVVRVKYTCTLVTTGQVVSSTKNGMQRGWVEFVLGIGQTIKGFSRALPLMSVGERSKITVTGEYAYGKEGLFPHIPPDAELCFDLTLLGYRPRTIWVKQLIQEPGLSEDPYWEDTSKLGGDHEPSLPK